MNAILKTNNQEIEFSFEIVNGMIIWLKYRYLGTDLVHFAKTRALQVDKKGYYFMFYKKKVRVDVY